MMKDRILEIFRRIFGLYQIHARFDKIEVRIASIATELSYLKQENRITSAPVKTVEQRIPRTLRAPVSKRNGTKETGLRVLIYGGFGVPNAGDEAILYGLSCFYSDYFPGSELYIMTANPNYSGLFEGAPNVSHIFTSSLNHLVANSAYKERIHTIDFDSICNMFTKQPDHTTPSHVRVLSTIFERLDLIHIGGGGYFNQKFLHTAEACALLASVAERFCIPMIATGLTFGPFDKKQSKTIVKYILQRLAYLDVRDSFNSELIEKNNIKYKITCDDALMISIFSNVIEEKNINSESVLYKINIQMGDSLTLDIENANEVLCGILKGLTERYGDRIKFRIMQHFPGLNSDFLAIAPAIKKARLSSDNIEYVDLSYMPPSELANEYARGDYTIASRFHPAVLSYLVGCPSYSLLLGHAGDRMLYLHKQFNSTNVTTFENASIEAIVDTVCKELESETRKEASVVLRERARQIGLNKSKELSNVVKKLCDTSN